MNEESLERIEAARLTGTETLDFEVLDSHWQLSQVQLRCWEQLGM